MTPLTADALPQELPGAGKNVPAQHSESPDAQLARWILTASNLSVDEITNRITAGMLRVMQDIAMKMHVLEKDECKLLLVNKKFLSSDIERLRRRYQYLTEMPPITDVEIFPDTDAIVENLHFNRAYLENLKTRQFMDLRRANDIQVIIEETENLWFTWDYLRDARNAKLPTHRRVYALKGLRERIGMESYYSGHMPPYVPIWRFQEIK